MLIDIPCTANAQTVELEFMNFQTPSQDGYTHESSHKDLGSFLTKNSPTSLRHLTSGMFGYSISRPVANKAYFYDIFDNSELFKCNVEGWHTESGPGVFEAVSGLFPNTPLRLTCLQALAMNEVSEIADRVSLFK